MARALKEAAEGAPAQDMEVEALAADGRHLPVEVTTFPIVEEGEIVAFQCVLRDITERKRLEEELTRSAQQWQNTFDAIQDIVMIIDRDYRVVRANMAVNNAFPDAEVVGAYCYELCHGCDAPPAECPSCQAFLTGETVHAELCEKHLGGRWFDIRAHPIPSTDGTVDTLVHVLRDITERKQAEEALRESEERYHMIADRVSDVIWIMDMDLRYTYVSPSGVQGRGYSVEELMAQSIEDALTPASLEVAMTALEEELALERMEGKDPDRSRTMELEFTCKDGSTRWGELTVTFLHDANGQPTGILGVTRDITDRRHAEEQLRRAQKMEAVGTLAGGIAHDFNNILQALIGRAELMLITGDFDAQTTTNLQEMMNTGWRGASLVKRLLVFSQQVEPRKQSICLQKSIEDVQLILERTISKLITIETDVQEGLWHVEADPQQMEQVLLNMGINAADAMPGAGALKMAAENLVVDEQDGELAAGRYVVLSVCDTGTGIDKEHLEHIYEPFYTSKERAEHSGLGLAIVHGIVESHGGLLRVSSEPGVGTTFRVYQPAAEPVAAVEEVTKESAVTPGPLTVLVVDDEPSVARSLCDILENSGHHTLRAPDGAEGLEIFRAHHQEIDVVLLDLIMPKLEGERCLEEMLAIDPEAVVVIATGVFLDDAARERLEPKIKGFVTKPFELHDVLRAIRKAAYGD